MPRIKGIHKNLATFLDLIAWAEGTKYKGDDGYNVQFTGKLFFNYDDHPRERIRGNSIVSSAAGRYQILMRYWDVYKRKLKLDNFKPESQDKVAIQMIREQMVIQLIHNGDIRSAITKCSNIWASFPGANYNQPEKSMDEMLYKFELYSLTHRG